jgi:hypothetical protein
MFFEVTRGRRRLLRSKMHRAFFPQMMAPSETVIGILKRLRRILAKSRDDFDGWARYLGDAPLATAMLDRLVDGAVVIKIKWPS